VFLTIGLVTLLFGTGLRLLLGPLTNLQVDSTESGISVALHFGKVLEVPATASNLVAQNMIFRRAGVPALAGITRARKSVGFAG
jgi:hypothetical protein